MKHAYLIMAHNEPYILERLIRLIDDERNDIFLHIDKKWKDFDFNYFKDIVKRSHLYFTERLDVKWGTNKQIKCELVLFETASKNGKYAYYHLLSGVDLPLVNQDEIHDFFDKNLGKEFVVFDNHESISKSALERISLYHFLVPWARSHNRFKKSFFGKFHFRSLRLMRKFNIDRTKNDSIQFRKGANWVSITDDFVHYILDNAKKYQKFFKYSFCADELFVQTILYNSVFYSRVFSKQNDDYEGMKRLIDWNRGQPYTFREEDYDMIINSGCFFARKFSTSIDKKIIDRICEKGMKNRG